LKRKFKIMTHNIDQLKDSISKKDTEIANELKEEQKIAKDNNK